MPAGKQRKRFAVTVATETPAVAIRCPVPAVQEAAQTVNESVARHATESDDRFFGRKLQ